MRGRTLATPWYIQPSVSVINPLAHDPWPINAHSIHLVFMAAPLFLLHAVALKLYILAAKSPRTPADCLTHAHSLNMNIYTLFLFTLSSPPQLQLNLFWKLVSDAWKDTFE